jgi:ribose 5-phosphate isomerase B
LCISIDHAIISRKHNDANVLALGARFISLKTMLEISENWLKTDFEGGRHQIRINKIEDF